MASNPDMMVTADKRANWLTDCLLHSIQFHIWADATRKEAAEVIDHINEGTCWDSHTAALVQVPRGITTQEAQEAVDAAFNRLAHTPAEGLDREAVAIQDLIDRPALKAKLDELIIAASRQWGTGSTEHNLVRDISDAVTRAPRILALKSPAPSDAGRDEGRRANPNSTVIEDPDDGFQPVEVVIGGLVYIWQGGAQLTMTPEHAALVAAALNEKER